MDEKELLRKYADGADQEAFGQLVRLHGDWVYSAARRQLGDEHLAEDVTQAVFLLLARRAKRLAGYAYVGGWLFGALRYCVKEAKRARSRQQAREREAAEMRSERVPQESDWGEIGPVLEEAMAGLGTMDREAILLRYYQRKPLAELGAMLGVSEEAARKRVDRAVGKLRGMLQKQGVTGTSAGLSAVLVGNVVQEVPARVVEGVMSAIGGGGSVVAGGIAKGAMKMMTLTQVKLVAGIVLGIAVAGGVAASAATRGPVTAKSGSATTQPMRETLRLADLSKEERMHIREVSSGRANSGPQTQDAWYVRGKGLASLAKWPDREVVAFLDESGIGWKYRIGRDVVGRTAEKMTASQVQAQMLQQLMSMQDQNPTRDSAGDRVSGGVTYRCFRLPAGPNSPAQTIWVDAANRIVASKNEMSEAEITYNDVAPADLFSTDWGKGVEVIDSDKYLPNRYPLDRAVLVKEVGRSVFAVHEYGRDAGGCYYLICSTRPAKGADNADATDADAAQPWLSGFVGNSRPVKRLGYIPREIASADSWDHRACVKWYLVTPDPAARDAQGTLELRAGVGTTRSGTASEESMLDFGGRTPTATTAAEFAGNAWTEVDRLWPALQAGYWVVTYGENGKGHGVTNPREPGELSKEEFLKNVATQIERARK